MVNYILCLLGSFSPALAGPLAYHFILSPTGTFPHSRTLRLQTFDSLNIFYS